MKMFIKLEKYYIKTRFLNITNNLGSYRRFDCHWWLLLWTISSQLLRWRSLIEVKMLVWVEMY